MTDQCDQCGCVPITLHQCAECDSVVCLVCWNAEHQQCNWCTEDNSEMEDDDD